MFVVMVRLKGEGLLFIWLSLSVPLAGATNKAKLCVEGRKGSLCLYVRVVVHDRSIKPSRFKRTLIYLVLALFRRDEAEGEISHRASVGHGRAELRNILECLA